MMVVIAVAVLIVGLLLIIGLFVWLDTRPAPESEPEPEPEREREPRTTNWHGDRQRLPSWLRWNIYFAFDRRCHYGGAWLKPHKTVECGYFWEIDHKHPVCRGGTDDEDNLVLSCRRHNRMKGTQSYADFKDMLAADKSLQACGNDW